MKIDQITPDQVTAMTDAERRDLLVKVITDYNSLASAVEDFLDDVPGWGEDIPAADVDRLATLVGYR